MKVISFDDFCEEVSKDRSLKKRLRKIKANDSMFGDDLYVKVYLRDVYPDVYSGKENVTVSKDVAFILYETVTAEESEERKRWRYNAFGYIDSPEFLFNNLAEKEKPISDKAEEKYLMEELYSDMLDMTEKEMRRFVAHYCLGLSMRSIARIEGIHHSVVPRTIYTALRKIKNNL